MIHYNVINFNFNRKKFEAYDVMEYLTSSYETAREKPETFDEFKKFVEKESMYMYWARCEYEIILRDWPSQTEEEKWDIHRQIMMNIDIVTDILMKNVGKK